VPLRDVCVANSDVERASAQRVDPTQMEDPRAGPQPRENFAAHKAAMRRRFHLSSLAVVLIMASVFAPITIIHVPATSVFQ
jgi:hypothetical protein